MKRSLIITLILATAILILANCTDSSKTTKPRFTMAKDSELTLLMRDMYEYFDSIKVDIKSGVLDENVKTFAEIHQAVATEPSKSSSDLYKAMAGAYLSSSKRINAPGKDKIQSFNLMVDNCMNCHKQMCPGPMVKIEKLYIE